MSIFVWVLVEGAGWGEGEFLAKVQVGNRIQIPVLFRWRNKLEPGEVLTVTVRDDGEQRFYARTNRDVSHNDPQGVAEDLELKPGVVVEVKLHLETVLIRVQYRALLERC